MLEMTAEHRLDTVKRIERVRRWTRNGDILALCDTLAKLIADVGSTASSVGSTAKGKPVTGALAYCPECAKRKETKRIEMARYRQRKAGTKAE